MNKTRINYYTIYSGERSIAIICMVRSEAGGRAKAKKKWNN